MITIVPNKKYWWAKLFTYIHGASLRAGNKTLPGEIKGRLLKISYVAYTKKRASRCGTQLVRSSFDSSRSLTKKLSYSSQYPIGFTGQKCDTNLSLSIILISPLPLVANTAYTSLNSCNKKYRCPLRTLLPLSSV